MNILDLHKYLKDEVPQITSSSDSWKSFLKFCGNHYKHSLENQLLIYIQRPDAIAVASMDIWNKKMERWVNKNTKGIASIAKSGKKDVVKYLFDVTDTHEAYYKTSKPINLWKLSELSNIQIINTLSSFTELKEDVPLDVAINKVNKSLIELHIAEYISKLNIFDEISQNSSDCLTKKTFTDILNLSLSYTILSRCGLDIFCNDIKFDSILSKLNMSDLTITLATLNTQISQLVLKTIEKRIKLERIQNNEQTNLHQTRRYTDTEPSTSRKSNRDRFHDEIRIETQEIYKGEQLSIIQPISNIRRFKPAPSRYRKSSMLNGGKLNRANEEKRWHNRRTEISRPNEVGRINEQHQILSRGNNPNPNHLRLNSPLDYNPQITLFEGYNHLNHEIKDFKITDNLIGNWTKSEKTQNNIEAIKLLKELDRENRSASPEEQSILSKYVGWGGLSDIFNENHQSYNQLKSLLSDKELDSAKESTLTSFYTPPEVISYIYSALDKFEFKKGNILEPSCGIGNFFGMLPTTMEKSNLYGVEIDSISGSIAKHLYTKSNISIQGYEDTSFTDNFFDIAIGNVPFGQFKVNDVIYNKNNFMIHDYFFAKTLDKVLSGGIIAFITSKWTLDKENPQVRKYIAKRAEFIGAIRLPNNTFAKNAGTTITSDIIFLKKRDNPIDIEPDWIYLDKDKNGFIQNKYFVENPQMILGDFVEISGRYGPETACIAKKDISIKKLFDIALNNLNTTISTPLNNIDVTLNNKNIVPSNNTIKNFSFAFVNDFLYFREDEIMKSIDVNEDNKNRIIGMINLREHTRELIRLQSENYPDDAILEKQKELNLLYDNFTIKYGIINSKKNENIFHDDSSYCLLSCLENLDEDRNFKEKAAIFSKRTIRPNKIITNVNTAAEALAVSIREKAEVDIEYMSSLSSMSAEKIIKDLSGVIFKVPSTSDIYQTADEYLSGNVREKLLIAKNFAKQDSEFNINVEALSNVQPQDLDATEIDVRLGSTWIDALYIQEFIFELLQSSYFSQKVIKVTYSPILNVWNITNKSYDKNNILANSTYGTSRINAYKIIEDTLNLKDVQIYDVHQVDGKEKRILNHIETTNAQQKQDLIQLKFKDWIFSVTNIRKILVRKYNELYNSHRPRQFDGQHIKFSGMNNEISLRPHQVNAIARILYGGNTLLAHVVGAGKTYEMVASAMEGKRLGLFSKPLFVVPNHLTGQMASDFLRLYPAANILAVTKKDFMRDNRKKFCSRIATGDYDAVIIGHTQFEKIPLSKERKTLFIQKQIDTIVNEIETVKLNHGDRITIKQLQKTKKTLSVRLEILLNENKKDNVITFEELGIDKLYVDEAHNFKNLFLYTKMRNVAGIGQSESQKAFDMYLKCRYMDEISNSRGIVFATGTPVSNSMVELYTMQRYLQNDRLETLSLSHFDSWAANFGETQTAIELSPEGTGYRAKTRFSKFFNLPELINIFKDVADIQTADMLNLPCPKLKDGKITDVVSSPSDIQKDMIKSLADRADIVRNRAIKPELDNMLKITNDGKKLALDQRLINPLLSDYEYSKVNMCINNIYQIWNDTKNENLTQLVFCDLSTPSSEFNVYDDIRNKLILKSVPIEQIAFIHDAKTEIQKDTLFSKVRAGHIRVLIGSTSKMGAGTNVQKKLVAIHHLDVPWRPSDIEQREGRILRQGNENEEVMIFRYITKDTFDAYSWSIIENKQKFISQIMTSKSPVRSCDDIDDATLSYAEVKALATGNPLIKEKMDLDVQVIKLKALKSGYLKQKYMLEEQIAKILPAQITNETICNDLLKKDYIVANNHPFNSEDFSKTPMLIDNTLIIDKQTAGAALLKQCNNFSDISSKKIGEFRGFDMELLFDSFSKIFVLSLKMHSSHQINLSDNIYGNISRINNAIESIHEKLKKSDANLIDLNQQLKNAKIEVIKPFPQEDLFNEKIGKLNKLNTALSQTEKLSSSDKNNKSILNSENPVNKNYSIYLKNWKKQIKREKQNELISETFNQSVIKSTKKYSFKQKDISRNIQAIEL